MFPLRLVLIGFENYSRSTLRLSLCSIMFNFTVPPLRTFYGLVMCGSSIRRCQRVCRALTCRQVFAAVV